MADTLCSDTWRVICSNLDVIDIRSLRLTCKSFNCFSNSIYLWRMLLTRDFEKKGKWTKKYLKNPYMYYIGRYKQENNICGKRTYPRLIYPLYWCRDANHNIIIKNRKIDKLTYNYTSINWFFVMK